MVPDRGLSNSNKQSGVKAKNIRLTYAFTSNADGSRNFHLLLLEKHQDHGLLIKRLVYSWGSTTETMQRPG
jgi:hypothetical protein